MHGHPVYLVGPQPVNPYSKLLTFGWHRDWLVCLGQEWRIIWKAKWSLVKVLYLIARYWSLFAMSFSLWSFTANFSYSECEKVVHWIVRIPKLC